MSFSPSVSLCYVGVLLLKSKIWSYKAISANHKNFARNISYNYGIYECEILVWFGSISVLSITIYWFEAAFIRNKYD